jgi:HAMP domain-containing protein
MKSIGRVLAALSAIGILMAALILGTSLLTARLTGEAAKKIFVSKDVTADILPPPLYLIEMRLVLSQAAEGSLAADKANSEVQRLAKEYQERVDYWTKNPPYGLESKLLGAQHSLANQFIGSVGDALKAVASGNAESVRKAVQAAHGIYLAHRTAVDDTVKASAAFADTTAETYKTTLRNSMLMQWLIFGFALGSMAVATVWVNRRVTRPIEQALAIAKAIANGDLNQEIRVTTKDETGQLLTALQVMMKNLRKSADAAASSLQQEVSARVDPKDSRRKYTHQKCAGQVQHQCHDCRCQQPYHLHE